LSNPNTCQQHTLARNGVAHVQRCVDCDCISIHLGPFTLRLDEAGLEALWTALGDAAAELHAGKAQRSRENLRPGLA
jgi:hypothetical protein